MRSILFILTLLLMGNLSAINAQDQGERNVLQFTGVIIAEDTEFSVPGVHVFVPKGGRGTTSDLYGYFSMPVLNGDSLVVSAVGFEREQIVIPSDQMDDLTVIIRLASDTTYLPELEVYPFPSEEMFKEAILAFQLPAEYHNMDRNVDQEMLAKIYRGTNMGASANHYFYSQQQAYAYNRRFQTNSISLLNPFAWNQFIKSLKKSKSER